MISEQKKVLGSEELEYILNNLYSDQGRAQFLLILKEKRMLPQEYIPRAREIFDQAGWFGVRVPEMIIIQGVKSSYEKNLLNLSEKRVISPRYAKKELKIFGESGFDKPIILKTTKKNERNALLRKAREVEIVGIPYIAIMIYETIPWYGGAHVTCKNIRMDDQAEFYRSLDGLMRELRVY